ncbi:MAG: hypothetical protein B2I17_04910 [Thermoplasmatales archaeon B_DKE]|nr:MAG: hypothetical protein B2I17_04910 [Thermoplasmatales archaeon B_DKE]
MYPFATENVIISHCEFIQVKLPEFLDSELVILWEGNNQICHLSSRYGIKSTCEIFRESNGGEIVYYLPTDLDHDRDGALFLKEFSAEKFEGMYIVRRSLEDERLSVAFFDFVSIPSVILVSASLNSGVYKFVFIFHNSVMERVSSTLLEISSKTPLKIEYLGRSRGLHYILGKINETVPLLVMESSGIAPEFEITQERNPIGGNWTRIVKPTLYDESISAVYKSEEIPVSNLALRVAEGIYEARTYNPVTESLKREERKHWLAHTMRIHNLNGRLLTVTNIFPESFGNTPIKMLSDASEKFPDWKIRINAFRKFNENPATS